VRPLAAALTDERRKTKATHGGVIAEIMELDNGRLDEAVRDLYDYLTHPSARQPARYPHPFWRMVAEIYAACVEEQGFREAAVNSELKIGDRWLS
jgi:hypothetical protein